MKVANSIDDVKKPSKVKEIKILNDYEKVDEAANLQPDGKVRVEHIEQSAGKFNLLSHENVINGIHKVDHEDHDNNNTEDDYL